MNVIIPGTFDCFHEGHKRLISYGWMLSGKTKIHIAINTQLIAMMNDKAIRDVMRVRGEKITKYLNERKIKAELHIIYDSPDTIELAKELSPCWWLTGRDWDLETTSKRNDVLESFWEQNNIYLIYKDRLPNISSTIIRNIKRKK